MRVSPSSVATSFSSARALSLRRPLVTVLSSRFSSLLLPCECNSRWMSLMLARAYHTSSVFILANARIACGYAPTI